MPKGVTKIAKALRKRPTDAENLLWSRLRQKQLNGLRFRRQEPIEGFVVDFICYEKRVVIEVDGGQHNSNKKDLARDACLKQNDFTVLRFWNNEVLTNIEGVLEVISAKC